MNKKRFYDYMSIRPIILIFLFAIAGFIMHNADAVKPVNIKKPLSYFPQTIGGWQAVKVIVQSESVVSMLGVTDSINYKYANSEGMLIDFYVGFYHAVGVDGSYHSPKNCLPGAGWGISKIKKVKLYFRDRQPVIVTELIVQNGQKYQVVLYWYQNRGRIIASEYWEKIYLVIDALLKHRRDGSFVRIMAYCDSSTIEKTEKKLQDFGSIALRRLEAFLPGEEL